MGWQPNLKSRFQQRGHFTTQVLSTCVGCKIIRQSQQQAFDFCKKNNLWRTFDTVWFPPWTHWPGSQDVWAVSLPSKHWHRVAPGHVAHELLKSGGITRELNIQPCPSILDCRWFSFLPSCLPRSPTICDFGNDLYSCGMRVGKCWCPLVQRARHAEWSYTGPLCFSQLPHWLAGRWSFFFPYHILLKLAQRVPSKIHLFFPPLSLPWMFFLLLLLLLLYSRPNRFGYLAFVRSGPSNV